MFPVETILFQLQNNVLLPLSGHGIRGKVLALRQIWLNLSTSDELHDLCLDTRVFLSLFLSDRIDHASQRFYSVSLKCHHAASWPLLLPIILSSPMDLEQLT